MSGTSKVTIHMVQSLDGFVASKDDRVDWMQSEEHYEKGEVLTEEYISNFLNAIDCYVMGSRTYQHALKLGWTYGEVPVFVVSGSKISSERKSVHFFNGDLDTLINLQLKKQFQNIWMVGGSQLTRSMLQADLADEIVVSIMPVVLGDGTPFFDHIGEQVKLHLKENTAYKDGMVELTYQVVKTK